MILRPLQYPLGTNYILSLHTKNICLVIQTPVQIIEIEEAIKPFLIGIVGKLDERSI